MKAIVGAVVAAFVATSGWTWAQSRDDEPVQRQAVTQSVEPTNPLLRWLVAATPSTNHATLNQFVGTWNVQGKSYPPGMDRSIDVSGSSEISWYMDGRFIREEFLGNIGMPELAGTQTPTICRGLGLVGYDNVKSTYTGVWIDNFNTQMLKAVGQWDATNRRLNMEGKVDDPMSGRKDLPVRYVIETIDDQSFSVLIEYVIDGEPVTLTEARYTRQ